VAEPGLSGELRATICSDEDYATTAKPQIDWDDQAAHDALVDSRTRDATAMLALLDGREPDDLVGPAVQLLASVVGQDIT
jgi:hypothetical protein